MFLFYTSYGSWPWAWLKETEEQHLFFFFRSICLYICFFFHLPFKRTHYTTHRDICISFLCMALWIIIITLQWRERKRTETEWRKSAYKLWAYSYWEWNKWSENNSKIEEQLNVFRISSSAKIMIAKSKLKVDLKSIISNMAGIAMNFKSSSAIKLTDRPWKQTISQSLFYTNFQCQAQAQAHTTAYKNICARSTDNNTNNVTFEPVSPVLSDSQQRNSNNNKLSDLVRFDFVFNSLDSRVIYAIRIHVCELFTNKKWNKINISVSAERVSREIGDFGHDQIEHFVFRTENSTNSESYTHFSIENSIAQLLLFLVSLSVCVSVALCVRSFTCVGNLIKFAQTNTRFYRIHWNSHRLHAPTTRKQKRFVYCQLNYYIKMMMCLFHNHFCFVQMNKCVCVLVGWLSK